MSRAIVYVLDKFVWILLTVCVCAQALQIAGVIEGPKVLGQITYPQDNEHEFKLTAMDSREKRQVQQQRFELLDNIFNIPIATLNSVNELLQSTRRIRLNNQVNQQNQVNRAPRRTPKHPHHYMDGPRVQADGSSSRVLLNI